MIYSGTNFIKELPQKFKNNLKLGISGKTSGNFKIIGAGILLILFTLSKDEFPTLSSYSPLGSFTDSVKSNF